MAATIPTITTGMTSGFTVNYSQSSASTFDYDNYSWTKVQNLINYGVELLALPSITNINLNILKRALLLHKITVTRYYN